MNELHNFLQLFKNPLKLIKPLGSRGLLNWLPDEIYLKFVFKACLNKKLNLTNPQTYNEKLQWLKINYRDPLYPKIVDKYEVRTFIKKQIGEDYLIPLIDVYNNVEEIEWETLPKKFVLKCTHGSGTNIICKNKDKLDIEKAKKQIEKWMKKNWYWYGREWAYKKIKPRIICEHLLQNSNGDLPNDYKFMCFNGEPKMVQVFQGRDKKNLTKDFYNMNWEKMSIQQGAPNSNNKIAKPINFELMVSIAKKISKNFPFARVDLYELNGEVYFGEITLYPASGFTPFNNKKYDYLFGEWLELPSKNN